MNMFQLEVKELKRIMDVCKKTVSKDMSKPILTQINLKYKDEVLTASAVDGFRVNQVLVREVVTDSDLFEVNIPVIAVTEKVLDVNIYFDDRRIRFEYIGGKKEEYYLIEGDFVKVDQSFPKGEPEFTIGVNPKLLKEMCEAYMKNGVKAMELKFYGKLSPIVVETGSSRQLILPLRL